MSHFTEADIRAGANGQTFQRGADYYRSGAVTDVVQRGNAITAKVAGSEYQPYQVVVTLAADGSIDDATCTCPYDWGGFCKHIVALLLTVQNKASAVSVKPALDVLLAGLTDAQLRRIIGNLVEDQPSLVAAIEEEIEWLQTDADAATETAAPSATQAMTVDIGTIRRTMHKEFRAVTSGVEDDANHYWDDDVPSFDPYQVLEPHLGTARALLAAGDGGGDTHHHGRDRGMGHRPCHPGGLDLRVQRGRDR